MALIGLWLLAYALTWVAVVSLLLGLCCLPFRSVRRSGAAMVAVAVVWGLGLFGYQYVRHERNLLRTPSPDGRSVVWLHEKWSNESEVKWKTPNGSGKLSMGMTERVIISPDPPLKARGFVWFPEGDRFFVQWGGYYGGRKGAVIETADGKDRMPTEAEVRWLLATDTAGPGAKRLAWLIAQWCEYGLPPDLDPSRPSGKAPPVAGGERE